MQILKRFLLRLVLVLSLGLAFAISPSFSQQMDGPPQTYEQAMSLLSSTKNKLLEAQKQLTICQQLLKDRSQASPLYEAKIQELTQTISDLTLQINSLKSIRDSLQINLDSSATTITDLNNQITTLESQLTQLKAQLAALSMTFDLYKSTNDSLVKNLELQTQGYKIAAIVFGVGTFTGGGYIISGNKWEGAAAGALTAGGVWALGHFVFHAW